MIEIQHDRLICFFFSMKLIENKLKANQAGQQCRVYICSDEFNVLHLDICKLYRTAYKSQSFSLVPYNLSSIHQHNTAFNEGSFLESSRKMPSRAPLSILTSRRQNESKRPPPQTGRNKSARHFLYIYLHSYRYARIRHTDALRTSSNPGRARERIFVLDPACACV